MKEPPITALAATRPELTWRECAFSEAASAWREAGTATVAKTATAAVMALTRKEFFMDECPEAEKKMRLNMEKSVSKPAPAPRNGLPCAAKNGAAGPQGLISAPRMPARALPVKPKEPPKGNHRREVARRKDFFMNIFNSISVWSRKRRPVPKIHKAPENSPEAKTTATSVQP